MCPLYTTVVAIILEVDEIEKLSTSNPSLSQR